jgi:uncharacterized protein YbjT (DUF2867 family)
MNAMERNAAMKPVLVTGGTGTLGKHVITRLQNTGLPFRVLTRSPKAGCGTFTYVTGDLETGEGVDAAVQGVETILHLAGSAKGDEVKARTLVTAARKAGNPHLIFISVVGADLIPMAGRLDNMMFGYFGAKHEAEQIIMSSGLPWTLLRATQFHDLVFMTAEQMAKMPIIPIPSGFRFQPISSDEVAARLVELAQEPPAGRVPDMAGPNIYTMEALMRSFLQKAGIRRPLIRIHMPGSAAKAFRNGANLAPENAVGTGTWETFLAEQFGAAPTRQQSMANS